MIESIIKSQTRQKLLIKFFVNIANTGYLNQLADEFSESTNSVRKELNNLTKANFLIKKTVQNKVVYQANKNHPLFYDLQNIVKKYLGIEDLVSTVLERMGSVREIFLLGDFANGIYTDQIDVLITGNNLNLDYISDLEIRLSNLLNKKVVIISSSSSKIKIDKLLVFSN